MTNRYIIAEKKGRVGIITLNRPERKNALCPEMREERAIQMDAWNKDPGIGAMVMTGAGEAFCSGADVGNWNKNIERREAGTIPQRTPDPKDTWTQYVARSKPIICAINGSCIGAGLTITLPCDVRIASERATFSMRFIRVGGVPELASTNLLPRIVGLGPAMELMLTGKTIDAHEAGRIRLVNRVVPHDRLLDDAVALAGEMAFNPNESLLAVKKLVWDNMFEADVMKVHQREHDEWQEAKARPYFKEAVRAFLEKRKPDFHKLDSKA